MKLLSILLVALTCLSVLGGGWEYYHYTAEDVRQHMPNRIDLIGKVWSMKYHDDWVIDESNILNVGEKPPYIIFTFDGIPAGTTSFGFKTDLTKSGWSTIEVYRQKITWSKYTYTVALWPDLEITDAIEKSPTMFFTSLRDRMNDVIVKIELIDGDAKEVIYDRNK